MQIIMWQESFTNAVVEHGFNNATIRAFFAKGRLAFLDTEGNMNYYKFNNMHFHAPSEHTFNGKHYDLELHLVHEIIDLDPTKN